MKFKSVFLLFVLALFFMSKPAHAGDGNPPCNSPCFINPTTGQLDCVCDHITGRNPVTVPEPGTMLLVGSGLAALALKRKKA